MSVRAITGSDTGWSPRRAADVLRHPEVRGVLMAASRDPDAKLTFVVTERPASADPLAVKIPTTTAAGVAVEREGRMLVELRRMPLGPVAGTVPRYVRSLDADGRQVLVATAMPGRPMSVSYHQFLHTARPTVVARDFALAAGWLRDFQSATAHGSAPVQHAGTVAASLGARWDGHPALREALRRLHLAHRHLSAWQTPCPAVHGDFGFGNVLVAGGRVSGVVDWEAGTTSGSPLRDLARFAISYGLYLDRHTRPGRIVAGHPGLRRVGFAPGIRYVLQGSGWMPRLVQGFLSEGLAQLGMPGSLWYDVAMAGVGEVAADANDTD
ncbi:MAG: phosphotransferase family protein, partial [Nocardioidaceae bacterium]